MYNKFTIKEKVIHDIKGGLIVSCQAREGWPMYGKEIMAAFASAAAAGGAAGIRASKPENIEEIRKKVSLPIIGINKIWDDNYDVYITPTYQSAVDIINAGSNIVAIDGTNRIRPNKETLGDIIKKIKENYPDILVMADISTFEEGIEAASLGADIVSTTLAGYTEYTMHIVGADFKLIQDLSKAISIPILAEGKIYTPDETLRALQCGAHAVVVGTAITRPEVITKWFSEKLRNVSKG
jgi:N-acylglucosamine-6-phosphate 2-epimerase